jgi:peptidoglycan/LPS O-acetylase OafA/YrhL
MALGYLLECWRVGEFRNPQIRSLILNLFMLQDVKALKPNVIVEPYMGNTPLWSLSYEWWFYVLYFPLVKWMRNSIWRNRLVFGVTLFCACWYVMSPDFVSRLLMYFLIWWAGVELSERYLNNSLNFGNILPVLIALLGVISLLVLNIFVYSRSGAEIRPGVHPVLEFRHFAFSIFSIVCALAWKRVHWIGFNLIFKPFLMLAPISYTLYISHYYFFVNNDWLPRMNSYIVNWIFYFLTACIFCFVVELRIYPRVRSWAFRQLRI